MKKAIFILIALITVSAVMAEQNPRDMKFEPIAFDPPMPERFVTDNGIVVFFLENHELPVVTCNIRFKGGNVYDPPAKIGLGAVTASMMRTGGAGVRTPDQVDIDLDYVAASIRSNSNNHSFALSLRCLKKDAELGFEILSDIIISPKFDSAKFELEKSMTKDRILRRDDSPRQLTYRVLLQNLYGNHPYGQYTSLNSIDNITRDDAIDLQNKYYVPDNCIMAIAGDMTLDEVKGFIAKYFGEWKGTVSSFDAIPMATDDYKPGVYHAEKDINQANIYLGNILMTDENPDRFAFEVMNFALGGGDFSSRITKQVRTTEGLAYSTGTWPNFRQYNGYLIGWCITGSETLSKALTMILDIIEEVKNNGITEEELIIAKESIINSYIFDFDTPSELVNAYAGNELRGFPLDKMKTDLQHYQSVTLEQCWETAQKYLNPKKLVIAVTGKKELFDQPLDIFGEVTEVPVGN